MNDSMSQQTCWFRGAERATPRRIAERLLDGITDLHSGEVNPVGCLELNTSLAGSKDAESVTQELVRGRELSG